MCSPTATPPEPPSAAGDQQHQDLAERGLVIATIDDLLSKVDSKYTLVHLAARRAREINNYYHSLGEGIGQYVRPLVESVDSNKPLSIALEEIAENKIVVSNSDEARAQAEALLGSDLADEQSEAEVVSLSDDDEA